eukprot:COSAG02_NODE_502_length_21039_cov_62.499045_26_plen_100_part_00
MLETLAPIQLSAVLRKGRYQRHVLPTPNTCVYGHWCYAPLLRQRYEQIACIAPYTLVFALDRHLDRGARWHSRALGAHLGRKRHCSWPLLLLARSVSHQ